MAGNNQAYNVCIRVPAGIKEAVDKDVAESLEFNSASQWYMTAIREYLEKRKKDRLGGGALTSLSKNKKNCQGFAPGLNRLLFLDRSIEVDQVVSGTSLPGPIG